MVLAAIYGMLSLYVRICLMCFGAEVEKYTWMRAAANVENRNHHMKLFILIITLKF